MKLPTARKILREDLKGAPDWISGIIDPINSFMEKIYQAMNKNITLQENIASFIKEITYTTEATYPNSQGKVTFKNELKTRPIGVLLMQIYDKNNYIPPVGPVYVPWVQNKDGDLEIHTITGLRPGVTYIIRLVIF